ncbi:DDE Tnp4 domain-containing protein [Trichonephila clavipes]|nr:DDE Tnp4 domain-containing protein [Trichonephila clavipes]
MLNYFKKSDALTSNDLDIAAAEGVWAYLAIQENHCFRSIYCASKLIESCLEPKFTCARTKSEGIAVNVLTSTAMKELKDDLDKSNCITIQNVASNHDNKKIYPIVVHYVHPYVGVERCLEDEQSSKEENNRSEENELFKNRSSEGAFQILVRQFQKITQQYSTKWNFTYCIGAIDGKHVRIKAPKNTGSLFYNYKDYHSMAVVDADYIFTAVDVGSYGREGDAGIFLRSEIGRRIKNNTFNIPPPKPLPGIDTVVPHVIVEDEAFALHQNLMKSYPRQQSLHDASKAIYNYRLSRARRTTKNAFGILCSYFRLSFRPISTAPETTEKIIINACILHKILREAKVLASGQTHIDSTLPLPVENFLPITEHNIRATTNHTQIW